MLCFGPDRRPERDLYQPAPLAARLPPADGDAALRALLTRYLYAYGPATPAQLRPVARHAAAAGPPSCSACWASELERVELDGTPAWTLAGDTATPPEPYRGIRLLPYFDAYVVAGQPRDRLYPGAVRSPRALTGGPGRKLPGTCSSTALLAASGTQRRSGRRLTIIC